MKETLVKCLFMGIIAPAIIVGGLLFGADYMAKTYIPEVVSEVESLNDIFDTEISEMDINPEAVPPLEFYGVKFDDSKKDLLERDLVVKGTYYHTIVLPKDAKLIVSETKDEDKEVSVYFHNDRVYAFSFSDSKESGITYSSVKDRLIKKYGTPHSWVVAPTSIIDIVEPSWDWDTGVSKTQVGCVINVWELPEHDMKIELSWIPDFTEYNVRWMLSGLGGQQGRTSLQYSRPSARASWMEEADNSFVY